MKFWIFGNDGNFSIFFVTFETFGNIGKFLYPFWTFETFGNLKIYSIIELIVDQYFLDIVLI